MSREFTDEELRPTLHNMELREGAVHRGSVTGYAKFQPSLVARWADCPGMFSWRRPHTEKEFVAAYDQEWPAPTEPKAKCCECHEHMGNDFYFLPFDRCLRRDGQCTKRRA